MKFLIITSVLHVDSDKKYFGYAPYIREMNIWLKHVDQVTIVAPLKKESIDALYLSYEHPNINFKKIPAIDFVTIKSKILSILKLPFIFGQIFLEMYKADHIHLRCPGNIGLIGSIVQIVFPKKIKTAKYAGNWDPRSDQPFSYKLQKKILSSTLITLNMKVLVYGEWPKMNKNIKSFFTASYSENEKLPIKEKNFDSVFNFVFVGTISSGKNALYAVQIVENLHKKGYKISLDLYGEGSERKALQNYIESNSLEKYITLKGNHDQQIVTEAYRKSHFVILPSKSEGWPKALAEGMFWGCVPISTAISCIPFMLDYGNRGILLHMDLELDLIQIQNVLKNQTDFFNRSKLASEWSRNFTTDSFENEIKKLLIK